MCHCLTICLRPYLYAGLICLTFVIYIYLIVVILTNAKCALVSSMTLFIYRVFNHIDLLEKPKGEAQFL